MTQTTAARLVCDETSARRIASFLAESLDAEQAACAAFEGDGGQWQVAVHVEGAADEPRLRDLVRLAAGDEAAQALRFERVVETDWVRQSLAGLKPVHAGRFLVHGSHDRSRVHANDLGIEIEAALGEGPARSAGGGVASNLRKPPPGSLALATLPRKRGRDKKVLDIGTGSGVLAIAVAKRLHARVVASDIDRVAVDAARNNARLNHAPRITFVHAPGASARAIAAHGPFDLILANILLGPLTRLAVPIRRLAAPHARVVLSGLLPSHANAALAHYAAQGFRLERRIPLDGWMTLVLTRGRCVRGRGR